MDTTKMIVFKSFLDKFDSSQTIIVLLLILLIVFLLNISNVTKIYSYFYKLLFNNNVYKSKLRITIDYDILKNIMGQNRDIVSKIEQIQLKNIIHRQMLYVSDKSNEIKNRLKVGFENAVNDKLNVVDSSTYNDIPNLIYKDIKHFETVIELMENSVKKDFRSAFIFNHFIDLTDDEFDRYVDDKFSTFFNNMMDVLLDYWSLQGSFMNIQDIRHYIRDNIQDDLKVIIRSVFVKAKIFAKENLADIEKLEEKYRENIESLGGSV